MSRLIWSRPAEADLFEVWDHLANEATPDLADAQLRRLHAVCLDLIKHPFRGRPRNELRAGLRSVLAPPYIVFYRVNDDAVEVLRVIHTRRYLEAIFKV